MKRVLFALAAFLTLVSSAFAQPIADGVYVIKFAAKPDYVLTLRDGNADNVNPVHLWEWKNDNSQKWKVTNQNGKIVIHSMVDDNYVLDVKDYNYNNETEIIVYTFHGADNQLWVPEKLSNGSYVLKTAGDPDFCLDLHNGEAVNDGFIKLYETHKGEPQQWKFEKETAGQGGGGSEDPSEGAVNGIFSVNPFGGSVKFSQGNLQYQASTGTWRFAEHQWDFVGHTYADSGRYHSGTVRGSSNEGIAAGSKNKGWIDLFGWGTSGYNGKMPYMHSINPADYGTGAFQDIDGTEYDWGVYNAISNGGNQAGLWRTLSHDEWDYILYTRKTPSNIRFAPGTVSGVHGLILLPDDWSASSYPLKNVNNTDDRGWENWLVNDISAADWNRRLEPAGAVFLPCAGNRGDVNYNDGINGGGTGPEGQLPFAGFYWASTIANFFPDDHGNDSAYMLYFSIDGWNGTVNPRYAIWPCIGCSVRLVTDNQ